MKNNDPHFISSKPNNLSSLKTNHKSIVCDVSDSDNEEDISSANNQNENSIRSDQLWAYLLNISPNSTPNFKKIICFVFSIPC